MKPTTLNTQLSTLNSRTPVPEFVHEGNTLRLCRNAKPNIGHAQLYCSRDGRFFSVTRRSVNQVKPCYAPERPARKTGGTAQYMYMRHFGGKACHILIFEAWIGERTPGMQIDHINGIPTDNRADNLQEVTPAENIKRAKLLRLLRKFNLPYYNEIKFNRQKLLDYFAQYDIDPGAGKQIDNPISYHLAEFPNC